MEIKKITQQEANNLYDSGHGTGEYAPIGLFYVKYPDQYVGIDNSTGQAWTESFKDKETMLRWLEGEDLDDD